MSVIFGFLIITHRSNSWWRPGNGGGVQRLPGTPARPPQPPDARQVPGATSLSAIVIELIFVESDEMMWQPIQSPSKL